MSSAAHQFINRGNLFINPVGPTIDEVPYPTQSLTKPKDYSLWVRDDLVKFSPVEVTRSAFRKSSHAYVGVIDSKGTPYYFALDSRGISVRPASTDTDRVWKTFAQLADEEQAMARDRRRREAAAEMVEVDRELSEPRHILLVKSEPFEKSAAWIRQELKAGRQVKHANGTRAYASSHRNGRVEMETSHFTVVSPHGEKTFHPTAEAAANLAHQHTQGVTKALPKKPKEEKAKSPPKKTTAAKKQAGAGGKTRYTYAGEKAGKKKPAGAKKPGASKPQPLLVVRHDDSKHADPAELCNQLGVSMRTLQRVARRLGREGFSKFMRSHLKAFSAKHRLDPDYWSTLYERLRASEADDGSL